MSLCSPPKLSMYTGRTVFKDSLPIIEPNGSAPHPTEAEAADATLRWVKAKTSQLDVVILTSALIVAAICGVFSWPTIQTAPWTAKAGFYSALIMALTSIFSGSQQSIALHRIGGSSVNRLRQYVWARKDRRHVAYIWQVPVMLMNISIWMLLIGLLILIWDRATFLEIWGGDMKIAFVATLATVFALANYVMGSIFIWRMNGDLYPKSTQGGKARK